MGKFANAADAGLDLIRRLTGRPQRGVPMDVADDAGRAVVGGRPAAAGDLVDVRGRPVEIDAESGWPHGVESWAASPSPRTRYVDTTPEFAAQLRSAVEGGPVLSGIDVGPLDSAPDFELGSPLWHQLDKGWRANDNLRRNRTPNLRNQNPELARVAGAELRARDSGAAQVRSADAERARALREGAGELAAAAAAAGLPFLLSSDSAPTKGDLTDTSGTADLAEESRPVPKVEPTAGEDAPPDYSYQARQLMNQLNALRRKAGGEVPESRAMMAEVNRLLSMSNNQRNAPEYKPAMPTDHHGEAQRLIQDLNARRAAEGGEVPDAPQVMAKVRQLQAMGDRMRNAG